MKDKQLVPVKNMDIKLDDATLLPKAKESGFIVRVRKFSASDFIRSLSLLALYATVSLESFATVLGLVAGSTISKQSLWERINPGCLAFVRSALVSLILRASNLEPLKHGGAFSHFSRVLLQDSTTIGLPDSMAHLFPGPTNQTGKRSATLKIQLIHELLSERHLHLGISGFTRNDQRASADILALARPGDLILRDLGYFSLKVFASLNQRGAYFLTRYWHRVNLYWQDGKRIDLVKLVKRYPIVDATIFAGSQERLPLRLIASPVPEPIAQMRRRKLLESTNKDRRLHPKKEQLDLLGWDIFLTNVGADIWDTSTALKVHHLRWRVEIIFKSWKSHFHLERLPKGDNPSYIELLIYSRLIFITLFQSFFAELACLHSGKYISLLKTAQFVEQHTWALVLPLVSPEVAQLVLAQILKHCAYETRRKRRNFHEKLSAFLT
jgi:hypothetical protein